MTRFGLVHGAGMGAWCWERFIAELEARGHQAATVDLPLNDQSAGANRLAEIVLAAFAPFDDLVLVGHSMSGLIIPVVASRRPVRSLVFLHAVLPRPGLSLADQVTAEPDIFNAEMMSVPPLSWSDEAIVTHFLSTSREVARNRQDIDVTSCPGVALRISPGHGGRHDALPLACGFRLRAVGTRRP